MKDTARRKNRINLVEYAMWKKRNLYDIKYVTILTEPCYFLKTLKVVVHVIFPNNN